MGASRGYTESVGSLRVWAIRNPPNLPAYYRVATPEEGAQLIDALAISDLQDRGISSNVFGLEVLVDGRWEEWCDDEGNTIGDIAEGR